MFRVGHNGDGQMNSVTNLDIKLMEGRTYTIGREGHIYIDSLTISKQHAEISITNGRIYLRDLNSTNGVYLVKNKSLVYFEEGFVNLLQPIVLGDQQYTVQSLLAKACDFIASDNSPTEVDLENNLQVFRKVS